MDDPQRPVGATSPGVTGTEASASGPVGARPLGTADFPGQSARWSGRRVLRPGERALVCVGAVVLAVYLGALVASADWVAHPVLAVVTAVSGAAAVAALTASAWARRPDHGLIWGRPLRWVPRPIRRDLARELRAGRSGPPELRPATVDWTCQTLQSPWNSAVPLAVIANSAGSLTLSGPTATWQLVALAVVVVSFALALTVEIARRRAARQVADALDELNALPPQCPKSADGP